MVTLTIGRYRAKRLLSDDGAMAAYLATDGQREVVLHVARDPDPGLDEKQFSRGLSALKQLPSSLPIARLLDGGAEPSMYWTATEYHGGPTWAKLYDVEATSPGPLTMTQQVIEIVSILEATHRIELIHGGFGPQSILMTGEGRLLLTDFGLTPLFRLPLPVDPRFRAPEHHARPMVVDARTDVHGVGVALFQLLTLRLPYRGSGAGALRQCVLSEPLCPDSARIPSCLRDIITRATAKSPSKRFAHMTELREALMEASHQLAVAALADIDLLDVESGERAVSKTDPSGTAPTSPDTLRSVQLTGLLSPCPAPAAPGGPEPAAPIATMPAAPPGVAAQAHAPAPGGPTPASPPAERTPLDPDDVRPKEAAARHRALAPSSWIAIALGLVAVATLLFRTSAPAVIVIQASAPSAPPPETAAPTPVPPAPAPLAMTPPITPSPPPPAPVPNRGVAPPPTSSRNTAPASALSAEPKKFPWETADPCRISWFRCGQ